MTEPRWTTERRERVLVVRPNRPPAHHFDERMSIELAALLRGIRRDRSLGAVVLAGADGRFVGHFDVPDLLRGCRSTPTTMPYGLARVVAPAAKAAARSPALDRRLRRTPAREAMLVGRTYECLRLMNAMDKVFVAAVEGPAVGMGCILALGCDLRVIADGDEPFGLQESALAMLAAAGGTQRLVRMAGSGRALELLLEGRWVRPREAVELGLASRVLPPGELFDDALATAQRLARRSPLINREIKRMVHDAGTRPFARALDMEAASLVHTVSSRQAERSMVHYLEAVASGSSLADAWAPLREHGVPDGPHRTPTTGRAA